MSAARKVAWFLFWGGVALAQWWCAYLLAVGLLLAFPGEVDSMASLLRVLALTWAADITSIFLLGWMALAIRRACQPRRMGLRLGLTAFISALLLLLPYLSYRIPTGLLSKTEQGLSRVATPAFAVWLAILGFHLPGWLRPAMKSAVPAEAT